MDQLNEAARRLERRTAEYSGVRGATEASGPQELCLRQKNRELLSKLSPTAVPSHCCADVSPMLLEEMKIEAQLRVWRDAKPEVLVTDDASIAASCRLKLKGSIEDHQVALCSIKEQLHTLGCKLERERELLKRCEALHTAMVAKLASLKGKTTATTTTTPTSSADVQSLKDAEERCRILQDKMVWFLVEYLGPKGGAEGGAMGRAEGGAMGGAERKRLNDVIEQLVNKCLEDEDPYLPADMVCSVHQQMLWKARVLETHPDSPHLIRLVPFHK